jgi:hypothetical protein
MRYWLVDFGASYVKTAIYTPKVDEISEYKEWYSPFNLQDSISKQNLIHFLIAKKSFYPRVDRVITCSILGGGYQGDIYYSWKNELGRNGKHCLFSGLFSNSKNYHMHSHHLGEENGLRFLGKLDDIPFYSNLGDTNCVIKSLNLTKEDVAVNLGTGSQVFYLPKDKNHIIINPYIPSGRAFLVFQELFNSLGLDIFEYMSKLTIEDIKNSNLDIDLNVFPQSHLFNGGGYIQNINEYSFNYKNLLGSILKRYLNQYCSYVNNTKSKNLIITGGIPIKLPLILDLFKDMFPNHNIIHNKTEIPNTHLGMVEYIKEYL